MPVYDSACYKQRKVKEWIDLARSGATCLPTFQRSYVWKADKSVNYLHALLENRPTGVFIILPTHSQLQFESYTVHGGEVASVPVSELVLDGQQRLRSLWKALAGEDDNRFYIQVEGIRSRNLSVVSVQSHSVSRGIGKKYVEPQLAYEANLIPAAILGQEACGHGPSAIYEWCELALPNDGSGARHLEGAIKTTLRDSLLNRQLTYCLLPETLPPPVAIDVFVETNTSSAPIKRFDIVVALSQQVHKEDFRERISKFHQASDHARHYFSSDPEKHIPEMGEWYLKVACLLGDLLPKESKYADAFDKLFANDRPSAEDLDSVESHLTEAMGWAAQHGAPTERTLPSRPPVYVIAALQPHLQAIRKATWRGTAEGLLSLYWWRALLTDRHQARANDNLAKDYEQLRDCLRQIAEDGRYKAATVDVLNEEEYPLATDKELDGLGWIGKKNRLSRAVASLVAYSGAVEWFTGAGLNQTAVRRLESLASLDMHHVFPRGVLKDFFEPAMINHGLNGVWLPKPVNQALANQDPRVYIQRTLEESQDLTAAQLRRNVESHLVPYDIMMTDEPVATRYPKFLKARAELVEERMKEVAAVEDSGV